MNKCYALVWNVSQGCWNVVSEGSRRRGKPAGAKAAIASALALLGATALAPAYALPSGGTVVGGSANGEIHLSGGNSLSVNQKVDKLIANWDSFSVAAGERVIFNQPSSSSIALNRVIGTKASAIQFVPRIAPQVQRLSLFQRSAPYVIAKPDRTYADWERRLKARWPWLQRLDRGLKYLHHESRMLAFATFPALMKVMRLSFRRHLHRQIADPQLRARLVPDYPLGCKRILISNDYYPALARSNVELVDTGIREVTEDAVVGRDGRRHEVDAIIFGTGFAATEFLAPMRILGLDGRDLRQAWADGAEAYKGISVSGFPNLFILYGPNTNLGHNSIVYMLESQFPYVLGCLRQLQAQGLRYLDVKPEVQRRFNLEVQQGLRHTVWERGCDSWYKTAAGKNTNNWPGYTFVYRWRTRRPELADYDLAR